MHGYKHTCPYPTSQACASSRSLTTTTVKILPPCTVDLNVSKLKENCTTRAAAGHAGPPRGQSCRGQCIGTDQCIGTSNEPCTLEEVDTQGAPTAFSYERWAIFVHVKAVLVLIVSFLGCSASFYTAKGHQRHQHHNASNWQECRVMSRTTP